MIQVLADGLGDLEDILQVGTAIFVGWGAHSAEDDVHLVEHFF